MTIHDKISINPDVCGGEPCIAGTRIQVALILGMLGSGNTIEQLLEAYPHITRKDILACVHYAADLVGQVRVYRSGAGEKVVLPANLVSGVVRASTPVARRQRPRPRRFQQYVVEEAQAA